MSTVTQVFEKIKETAESIKSDEPQRFSEAANHLDFRRQGDIYIYFIDNIPKQFTKCEFEAQLAPGTTKGSRHILSDEVAMFKNPNADVLTGPAFTNKSEVTIEHPEHGDVILPPGNYMVTYQRAFAEELRRVLD